jgi:hypothetical protein
MVWKLKYIKTKKNVIIAFCELLQHDDFKHFEPVSAGFMSIGTKKVKYGEQEYTETDCTCYGKSNSLGIESDPEVDSKLARNQILGHLPE